MDSYARRVYDLLLLTRPFNAVQPLLLVVAGAVVSGTSLESHELYLSLVAVLLIHGATTAWNDIEDLVIDKRNHVSTVLTNGFVTVRSVRRLVEIQVATMLALAVFLPPLTTVMIILLFIFGWQYNARPLCASRRPIASMVVLAVSYGLLPLFIGASLGRISREVVLLGIVWSVSRVSLSLLKDYKDAVGDAKSNKHTFLLVFGHSRVRLISLFGVMIGNTGVLLVAFGSVGKKGGLLLVALLACLYIATIAWRGRLFLKHSYQELNEVFHQALYLQVLFDGVVVLWLTTSSSL